VRFDKSTSTETLQDLDYPFVAPCSSTFSEKEPATSQWKDLIQTLHGDAFYKDSSLSNLWFGQDLYCAERCTSDSLSETFKQAAARDYVYRYWVDNMPAATKFETDETIRTNYWAGVPLAVPTEEGDLLVMNHINIELYYERVNDDDFRIVRTVIQPFSVDHSAATIYSCNSTVSRLEREHTNYEMVSFSPPVYLEDAASVKFTYDLIFRDVTDTKRNQHRTRWQILLSMDSAQPVAVKMLGIVVSLFCTAVTSVALWVWVSRDLSYKPIQMTYDVEPTPVALEELRMWPLSSRLFFPPRRGQRWFVAVCATGAHLLWTSLWFAILFRVGIISQSLWHDILTAGFVLHLLGTVPAGYVAGRLEGGIFHGSFTSVVQVTTMTTFGFFIIGFFVILLCYNGLVDSTTSPIRITGSHIGIMISTSFCFFPLTLLGAYLGHRHGPIEDFPVSQGSGGYHDLDLQKEEEAENSNGTNVNMSQEEIEILEWQQQASNVEVSNRYVSFCKKHGHMFAVWGLGGILPVLGVFVAYSYNVAGPVFVGYYTDNTSFLVASYLLFLICSGSVSVLGYYRQIRSQQRDDWWWSSFGTAGSAGLYLFLLTCSWLIYHNDNIETRTWFLFFVWFLFTSFGVVLITGFVGVASCIAFTKALYIRTKQRGCEI